MNISYNTGAISKMMIVNVLLAVLIAATVFVLLASDKRANTPKAVTPPSTAVTQAKTPQPVASANTQAEIAALKTQLENENSKLQRLRTLEEKIAEIRKETEQEEAMIAKQPSAEFKETAPEIDQAESGNSASQTTQ